MKYVLLTYATEDDWVVGEASRQDLAAPTAPARQRADELIVSGECVYAVGLADPTYTQTLEIRDGVPILTDGPYPAARDILAGIGIVEVASHDQALEVAARTATTVCRVEIRLLDGELGASPEWSADA